MSGVRDGNYRVPAGGGFIWRCLKRAGLDLHHGVPEFPHGLWIGDTHVTPEMARALSDLQGGKSKSEGKPMK